MLHLLGACRQIVPGLGGEPLGARLVEQRGLLDNGGQQGSAGVLCGFLIQLAGLGQSLVCGAGLLALLAEIGLPMIPEDTYAAIVNGTMA
jgi:hypothetical protein